MSNWNGKERRMSTEHQRGYEVKDREDAKAYAWIVLGGIILCAVIYTAAHYWGVK